MTDIYADTRRFADNLTAAGVLAWPQRLRDAIAAGSTGTEIVMGIRWTLTQMLSAVPSLPVNLVEQARRIIEEASALLQ